MTSTHPTNSSHALHPIWSSIEVIGPYLKYVEPQGPTGPYSIGTFTLCSDEINQNVHLQAEDELY